MMPTEILIDRNNFSNTGAAALAELHLQQMLAFYSTWKEAKLKNLILPDTDDPDCKSLDAILFHVFRASRRYIVWICDKLKLNCAQIDEQPPVEEVSAKAAEYLDHLLNNWHKPLYKITSADLDKVFTSNWGVEMSIESMLEHAVLHPLRHAHHLRRIMGNK